MTIQSRTIQLKFRDTAPKSLNTRQIQAGSVSVAGLAANEYEVGRVNADGTLDPAGTPPNAIRALAPKGDTLYTVSLSYDDTLPVFTSPFEAIRVQAQQAEDAITALPASATKTALVQLAQALRATVLELKRQSGG